MSFKVSLYIQVIHSADLNSQIVLYEAEAPWKSTSD